MIPSSDTIKPPNREEIKRLSLSNPIVRNCLSAHYVGTITYEQSLEVMVLLLAKSAEEYRDRLLREMQQYTAEDMLRDGMGDDVYKNWRTT